jgi:hypothetical protein
VFILVARCYVHEFFVLKLLEHDIHGASSLCLFELTQFDWKNNAAGRRCL